MLATACAPDSSVRLRWHLTRLLVCPDNPQDNCCPERPSSERAKCLRTRPPVHLFCNAAAGDCGAAGDGAAAGYGTATVLGTFVNRGRRGTAISNGAAACNGITAGDGTVAGDGASRRPCPDGCGRGRGGQKVLELSGRSPRQLAALIASRWNVPNVFAHASQFTHFA